MSLSAMSFRRALVAGFLAALLPVAAGAQSGPVVHIADASAVEADAGTTPMVFDLTLSAPSASDVTLDVVLLESTAQAGSDFVDATPIAVVFPAGTTHRQVSVEIVGDVLPENDENFYAGLDNVVGAQLSLIYTPARGEIVDDEPPPAPAYAAIDDRYVIAENSGPVNLVVVSNDIRSGDIDGTLTLVSAPAHGTVAVGAGLFEYVPDPDYSGPDPFRYRYCDPDGSGEQCDEADVDVVVRPIVPLDVTVGGDAGYATLPVTDLRALPSARFVATPLVASDPLAYANSVDATPSSPWDSPAGVTWDVRTLPAPSPGETLTRILVDEADYNGQALAIGVDANGDGEPSPAETGCFIADTPSRCELEVPRTAGATVNFWVLVHNRETMPMDGVVDVFVVPGVVSDGTFGATGPGHVERGEDFAIVVPFADDTMLDGDVRAAYVTVHADADTVVGAFPVLLRADAGTGEFIRRGLPLVDGRPHALDLAPGEAHRRAIIDVPPGATRLRVTSESDQDVDLYLVPMTSSVDPAQTDVDISPPLASAIASATGPGGDEVVEVSAASLFIGRWYVVAVNESGGRAKVTLTATVDATAPVVRDGSYFNPDRSGSGVFLYPAGDQWTGLWYTYLPDGTPTWYYLQAPQPGADGLWTSDIYRSAWDGDSNWLTSVGRVTLTPNGADRFQMTYRLDGHTGTQPMEVFGRGCPMGGAIDLSGTWFDPARAGSGYSVQLFPNYEYYAAYYYDELGIARFVAAELPAYGGAEAELVIQQLIGDCPTCNYDGAPARTDIGLLRRRVLSGDFQYIATDLEFDVPLTGSWTVTDAVQPLGGQGTTQGCDP